jgi:Domain of unknown function (DUF1918)
MQAAVGDRLHVHANIVGHPERTGEIVEVRGAGGEPPTRARDSIQTLVATRGSDGWRLAAFQNTRLHPIGSGFLAFLHWSIGDGLWGFFRLSTDPTVSIKRMLR